MPSAEQVSHATRLFVPIIMGSAAFVAGLLRGDMGIMALGAGLIGAPGVLRVVGGSTTGNTATVESTPLPPPAPAVKV